MLSRGHSPDSRVVETLISVLILHTAYVPPILVCTHDIPMLTGLQIFLPCSNVLGPLVLLYSETRLVSHPSAFVDVPVLIAPSARSLCVSTHVQGKRDYVNCVCAPRSRTVIADPRGKLPALPELPNAYPSPRFCSRWRLFYHKRKIVARVTPFVADPMWLSPGSSFEEYGCVSRSSLRLPSPLSCC